MGMIFYYVLGVLWCLSPACFYQFPAQLIEEGWEWPDHDTMRPSKPGGWGHHFRNYFVEIVRKNVQLISHALPFAFWSYWLYRGVIAWL